MAHLKLYILLWSFLIVSIFASTRRSFKNVDQNQNTDVIANSIMQLAVDISKNIKTSSAKNEIFSPISIAGALSLLLLGARGQTENELLEALHLKNVDRPHELIGKLLDDLVSNNVIHQPLWHTENKCFDDEEEDDEDEDEESQKHVVRVADALFVQQLFQLSDTYLADARNFYKSEVRNVDFINHEQQAADIINNWVKTATRNKITDIVSNSFSEDTRLIVTSALYFKADWTKAFFEGATKPKNFYIDGKDNDPIQVELMANGGCFPYYNSPELDLRIMGFPYKNNLSTMYVLLPNNSSRSKLQGLQLSVDDINNLINKMTRRQSIILFPKMKIKNSINLNRVMRHLKVHTLFDPRLSDLSKMIGIRRQETPSIVASSIRPETTQGNLDVQQIDFKNEEIYFPQQSNAETQKPTKTPDIVVRQPTATFSNRPTSSNSPTYQTSNLYNKKPTLSPSNVQRQPGSKPPSVSNEYYLQTSNIQSQQTPTVPNNWVSHTSSNESVLSSQYSNHNSNPDRITYQYSNQNSNPDRKTQYSNQNSNPNKMIQHSYQNSNPDRITYVTATNENLRPTNPPTEHHNYPIYRQETKKPEYHYTRNSAQTTSNPLYSHISSPVKDNSYNSQPLNDEFIVVNRNQNWRRQFKRQISSDPLYVNKIVHKIFLDINEKGTEGGAATSVSLDRMSSNIMFRVDAPFLLFIRHDSTGIPLFYGNVYDPRY